MVRTKKHFRPPSSSSSSESSDEEEDYNQVAAVPRGRGKQLGNYARGGKQLSMARQGGKQLSMAPPDDDDSSDEEDAPPPPPSRGGKQIRPRGMGKQLRAPSPQRDDDDDDDDSDSSDDSVARVPLGSGKRLGGMAGGGKMLRRQSINVEEEEDDSSDDDSDDDDAPWEVAAANRGQGKMLRPSPSSKKKEESDMDESSEEEEEEATKPAAATKEPIFDDSDDESEPEPAPAPAPKRRGRPPRAAATRASARAKSAQKALSSDSSDSDDDDESSEEELELDFETFDTQTLVRNDDDKKYLDSLPELEREAILAERFDELKKEADMKKALRENKRREREAKKAAEGGKKKKKTAASKKKKAPATKSKKAPPKKKQKVVEEDVEDSSEEEEAADTSADAAIAASLSGKRVSARNLAKKGKQFKKQVALAKIRESRANKKMEEESDSDLDYGRDSDDSDDDYEETAKPWQKKASKKKSTTQLQAAESSDESAVDMEEEDKDEPVKRTEDVDADQEDYAKVSIPRRRLIRWCNEPYFLEAIKNFYVRIGIGRDNKTQKACYRLCKIENIVEKDAYTFPASKGQKAVTTDKWLLVSFGKMKREFKMLTVSDHRPSVDDVAKYVGHLKNERSKSVLTKKKANKLRKKQDDLVTNYTYTKEDIEMLVKEKKKRNKKSANIGLEKTRMAIAVRAAEDAVKEIENKLDDAEVARMEADGEANEMAADENVKDLKQALEDAKKNLTEVRAEEERILKEDEERTNKLKANSKIQNWDRVNQRARLANQNADFAAYKEQQRAKSQTGGSTEPKFDPYARRKVKPKNLWEVKGAKNEEAVETTVEEEKKEGGTVVERDDANVTKEVDKENKRDETPDPQKNDLPAQNNFAFDDDIMIGGDIANLAGIGAKKTTTRVRKGISLEEYQSRKAAGTL